jgi:hypothetical protein
MTFMADLIVREAVDEFDLVKMCVYEPNTSGSYLYRETHEFVVDLPDKLEVLKAMRDDPFRLSLHLVKAHAYALADCERAEGYATLHTTQNRAYAQ